MCVVLVAYLGMHENAFRMHLRPDTYSKERIADAFTTEF